MFCAFQVIMCVKGTSERARTAAYDLLVKMGQKFLSWFPDKSPERKHEIILWYYAGFLISLVLCFLTSFVKRGIDVTLYKPSMSTNDLVFNTGNKRTSSSVDCLYLTWLTLLNWWDYESSVNWCMPVHICDDAIRFRSIVAWWQILIWAWNMIQYQVLMWHCA